jgi:hypothetical protein
VGGDYFRTLGVRAAVGRFFAPDEAHERGVAHVAVLGHSFWQRYFGGGDVVGRTLLADTTTYTIIGVAPAGFTGHTLSEIDFWLPMPASTAMLFGGVDWATMRNTRWLQIFVRLRENVTHAQALARVGVDWTAWNIRPERPNARAPRPYFVSMIPAESSVRPEHQVARLLVGVALLLLLITCANVANLLLARALARRREIAIPWRWV